MDSLKSNSSDVEQYEDILVDNFKKIIATGFWMLQKFGIDHEEMKIRGNGLLLPPHQNQDFDRFIIRYGEREKLVENITFENFNTLGKKPYLSKLGDGKTKRFRFTFKDDLLPKMLRTGFAMDFVSSKTLEPFRLSSSRYYIEDELPIPPKENVIRVAGNGSIASFRMVGYSSFMHLDSLLKKYFQKSIVDFKRICDWGCGCGRLTRYLTQVSNVDVTGLDIDEDNLKWCQKIFKNVSFLRVKSEPPVNLNDNSFDLIIGISVFTHLTEERQFHWLKELKRLARSGAIILVTINSERSWALNRPGKVQDLNVFNRRGIVDSFQNKNLDKVIDNKNDYVNTFHKHQYVYDKWKDYFDIIDIVEGGIGGYQDIVVMKNK